MNCPGIAARRSSIAGHRSRSVRCARSSPRRRRRAAPRRRWRWWWRCRAATSNFGAWPQAITSALSASCFGAPSAAPAVSAARSAKPSTLARSNGGTSIGAARSSASTRPSARGERDAFGRAAAKDRDGVRSAGAPPRPRPLRGIAPAARLARTAASSSPSLRARLGFAAHGHGLTTTRAPSG